MNHEQVRHFEKVVSEVGKTLVRNPRASINDLCRACKDVGLQVSKPLVARARKVIVRAVKAPLSHAKVTEEKDEKGERVVLIRTQTPPELMGPPMASPDEKAAKAERERARVVEQKERELEREMQWAKERVEERKAFEATHNAVVEAMRYKPTTPGENENGEAPPAPLPEPATGKTRSAADVAMRRAFLNALLDAEPGAHPQVLMGKLQAQFGTALSWSYLYETCRVAREVSGLPQLPEREGVEREPGLTRQGLPVFAPAEVVEPEVVTLAEDLQWLAQQARDVMRAHGLSDLALVADEAGAEWTWTEKPKSGSGKLKF